MNTPNIDSFFTEVAALRNNEDSLRIENEKLHKELANRPPWRVVDEHRIGIAKLDEEIVALKAELARKQESWDKAANYRDRVLELVKQCDEKSKRIDNLCEENAVLEKRINERYADADYHMNALNRLCSFVKPKDTSSASVVQATINWINRLLGENSKLHNDIFELRQAYNDLGGNTIASINDVSKDRDKLEAELSDVRRLWDLDHATMKGKVGEALGALRNLMVMFEEFHKFGHIPWVLDTKAASEARHILSKHP